MITPVHGALSRIAPNLTYTPNACYFGSDSFQFKVNNGVSDSNTATVSITVTQAAAAAVNVTTLVDIVRGGYRLRKR